MKRYLLAILLLLLCGVAYFWNAIVAYASLIFFGLLWLWKRK